MLGIALEGIYAAGLPLDEVFDPTVFRDVLDTRYGKVALVRLALLVLAFPLLRVLLRRRPAAEHPLRVVVEASALVVGVGLAVTPGIAGHAGTGIQTGLAIPADSIHVAGDGVLARRPRGAVRRRCCRARDRRRAPPGARRATPRSRSGAIVALVVRARSRRGARSAASTR